MPTVKFQVDNREYRELREIRGDQEWRGLMLTALDVKESPRKFGRPPNRQKGEKTLKILGDEE